MIGAVAVGHRTALASACRTTLPVSALGVLGGLLAKETPGRFRSPPSASSRLPQDNVNVVVGELLAPSRSGPLSPRQPRSCIGHANRMMPRSCSLVQSGGGSRAAHEPPKQHLMKRLVSCQGCGVLGCGAGPTTFGESFSRCSIYICDASRQTLTVVLGAFLTFFASIAIGIRFRHCPWDLQSPDARLPLPSSARPSKTLCHVHRPSLSNTSEVSS